MSTEDRPNFRFPDNLPVRGVASLAASRAPADGSWRDTVRAPSREDLLSPATQIVADRDAYLGQGRNDIGRRIAEDQVELFVSGEPAASLQREFEQHSADFIGVHDVGTSGSLRLLTTLAGASGARVQRLTIRRQGHGVPLAVLQFVEVPLADGSALRLYSTDVNTEGPTRQALAKVLLASSRLAVVLIGEMPAHALTAALAPLHDAMRGTAWPNREMLLVPLGSAGALAAQAKTLAADTPVAVHVTPQAIRPKHIWNFIGGTWNRLLGRPGGERAVETDIDRAVPKPPTPWSEAHTEPMDLRPLGPGGSGGPGGAAPRPSAPSRPRAMPAPGGTVWQGYVERCAAIKGAVAVCVFDTHSMEPLASIGGPPAADRMAQQGAAMLAAMADSTRALGLAQGGRTEATVSTGSHHVVLRPVPGHPGVALHLVLQGPTGNLTLARMQLERIEPPQ